MIHKKQQPAMAGSQYGVVRTGLGAVAPCPVIPAQAGIQLFKCRGFTLIEMMVVVAIVAILAAMAAPSYRDFIEKGRVKEATEEIYSFISQAKSDAILRDQDVELNFYDDGAGTWCIGYSMDESDASATDDCDCSGGGPACAIPVGEDAGGSIMVTQIIGSADFPDVTVSFNQTGGTRINSLRGTVDGRTVHIGSGNWGLSTVLSGQGRLRVCTNTAGGGYSKGVTGYEECN